MLNIIKQKISLKIVFVITSVVTVTSMLLFLYLSKITSEQMYKATNSTVDNALTLLAETYKNPVWNFSTDDVNIISKGVLNTPEFIAINVYNTEGFITGYKKIYKDSNFKDFINEQISEPFKIPENKQWLHKKTVKLNIDSNYIGYFELFYTYEIIINTNRSTKIDMALSLLLLTLIIIFVTHILMKKMVVMPITNLSSKASQIAVNKNYSTITEKRKISKHGKDEISKLYSSINYMLREINKKDKEREEIFSSLKKKDKNYTYIFNRLKSAVNNGDYSRVKVLNSHDNDLVKHLNTFLETLELSDAETKKRDWFKTGQTTLSDAISGERKLKSLCQNAINHITNYSNAQIGAIYVINAENSKELNFIAGYAFKQKKGFSGKFNMGDGLVGQVALERKTIVLNNLIKLDSDYTKPDSEKFGTFKSSTKGINADKSTTDKLDTEINTSLNIESSIGNMVPKNIILFPLVYEDNIKGVIELGSSNEFTPTIIEFLELASYTIATVINAALTSENLNELFVRTNKQAEKLRAQQEELKNTNIELETKAQNLKESEAQLQVQHEELLASNEEMEEKNKLFDKWREEINKKA